MPIATKEIELNDGVKVLVKQVSGRKKLKIEAIQARVYRSYRHFGSPLEWTTEQHEEFADALDEAGAGIEAQVENWLEDCILTEGIDIDDLTTEELMAVLNWVRGSELPEDDGEGSIPLDSSQE